MKRHRWGEKQSFRHKSEQQCRDCGIVKVKRHEVEGDRDVYWTEFWRGLDQIECDGTPACEAVSSMEEATS
jgi:hypothetical protein